MRHSLEGPAEVAVIASALMDLINGSAVANVSTTGAITIPFMKRTGYKKEFASATENLSSTDGQFSPPIMGALGFIMAELLNLSYTPIMVATILPAFLYYLGLLFAVHFEVHHLRLSGLSKEIIPDALKVVKDQGHPVIPPVTLILLLSPGYTPLYSAAIAIFVTIGTSRLRKDTRMTFDKLTVAAAEKSQNTVSVGVCCVIISIIIGTVTFPSLGLNMGYLILTTVDNTNVYMTALLVMIMSTFLCIGADPAVTS